MAVEKRKKEGWALNTGKAPLDFAKTGVEKLRTKTTCEGAEVSDANARSVNCVLRFGGNGAGAAL